METINERNELAPMTDQQANDLIAEAKKWLESAGHNGGPPARLLAALVELVSRQPQEPPKEPK